MVKMPVLNMYHYEPLREEDEIRLIILDPATHEEEPLSCSIIHQRRSKRDVDYFAISYVWGEPRFSQNLEVKCGDDVSYLRITPNVDTLLRHLRTLNVLHCLWIDAICLNQADKIEKAQQIPDMGRIFGEAKTVHIWLGLEGHMTGKLFDFFQKVVLLPESKKMEMASKIATIMQDIFGGGDGLLALKYFLEFFDRPWFSRRWIIQEACLAQKATVHCGGYSIPLPSLVLVAIRFQTLDISSYSVKVMANLRRPTTSNITLLKLLWDFHEAQCLEPKDRIAALFGLVQGDHWFYLDYTFHWAEVYKQVVLCILIHGNNDDKLQVMLHLFEFGSVSLPRITLYPTWVPDWSKSRQRDLPYHSSIRTSDTYEHYPLSPGYSQKSTLGCHHDALHIRWHVPTGSQRDGQVVYVAKFSSPSLSKDQKTKQFKKVLRELFPPTASTLRILTVSSLLKAVSEFRHSGRDLKLKSSPGDKLIRGIVRKLPESSRTETQDSLREMYSLLEDFCLFELESAEPRYQADTGYGMSSQQIQVNDIMIPLWKMEWTHDATNSPLRQMGATTYTMLAVRRLQDQSPLDTTGVSSEETSIGTGSVIGWSVCVLPEFEPIHKNNLSLKAMWDAWMDRGEQRSILLF